MASFGLGLTWLSMRAGSRKPGTLRQNLHRDLERLFNDIGKGLQTLSSSSRLGGFGLMQERQDEVERLLAELQKRLRFVEDRVRDKYEARAHRILAQAARYGITVPPP